MIYVRLLITLVMLLSCYSVTAENWTHPSFEEHGLESIGVYTQLYGEYRSELAQDYIKRIGLFHPYSQPKDKKNVYWGTSFNGTTRVAWIDKYSYPFRRQNALTWFLRFNTFSHVTPPLTSRYYPIAGETQLTEGGRSVDAAVKSVVADGLRQLGWSTEEIDGFEGSNLKNLLSYSAGKGVDALLLIRYYGVRSHVAVSDVSYGGNSLESANIGAYYEGIGILPCIELYDTETGVRLWYSAYHTSHIEADSRKSPEEYNEVFGDLFAASSYLRVANIDDNLVRFEKKNTRIGNQSENDNTVIPDTAAQNMVELTFENDDAPFPSFSDSERNRSVVTSVKWDKNLSDTLWSDQPEFRHTSGIFSIGYSLDYIGSLNIVQSQREISGDEYIEQLSKTTRNTLMHSMAVQFFGFEIKNLSFLPFYSWGFIPTIQVPVQEYDRSDSTYNNVSYSVIPTRAQLGLSAKYKFRLTDTFSIFAGGQASVNLWSINSSDEADFDLYSGVLLFAVDPNSGRTSFSIEDFGGFWGRKFGTYSVYSGLTLDYEFKVGISFEDNVPFDISFSLVPMGPEGQITFSVAMEFLRVRRRSVHDKDCEPAL